MLQLASYTRSQGAQQGIKRLKGKCRTLGEPSPSSSAQLLFPSIIYFIRFRTRFLSWVVGPYIQLTIEISTWIDHLSLSPFIVCLALLQDSNQEVILWSSLFSLTPPLSDEWPSCKEIFYSEDSLPPLSPRGYQSYQFLVYPTRI